MPLPGNQAGNYVPPTANTTILVTANYTTTFPVGPLLQPGAQSWQTGEGANDPLAQTLTWDQVPAILIRGPSDNGRYRIVLAASGIDLIETGSLADAQTQGNRLLFEIFGGPDVATDGTDLIASDGSVIEQP